MIHQQPNQRQPRRRRRRADGFTLIEAALATVIVGTGVLSIMAAQQAYHRKNDWANRSGTAMLLANEIRELMLGMPLHDPTTGMGNFGPETGENTVVTQSSALGFDDLDDFAGVVASGKGSGTVFIDNDATFKPSGPEKINGPIDARGVIIPGMEKWSQHVVVEQVDVNDPTIAVGFTSDRDKLFRITVTVYYEYSSSADPLATLVWLATPRH